MSHLSRSVATLVGIATIVAVADPVRAADSDRTILSKKVAKYALNRPGFLGGS